MSIFKYFLLNTLFFCRVSLIFSQKSNKPPNKLIVIASVREPFVVFDAKNNELRGLDVTLLREFGKKFNIPIEFMKLDVNLSEIIASDSKKFNFS